jgi:hypothetical protein
MYKLIYKYHLAPTAAVNNILTDHPISKVLKVGEQDGLLYAWIEHEPSEHVTGHYVYQIVPTGITFQQGTSEQNVILANENLSYRDTVIMSDGLVWHIYDGFYNECGM